MGRTAGRRSGLSRALKGALAKAHAARRVDKTAVAELPPSPATACSDTIVDYTLSPLTTPGSPSSLNLDDTISLAPIALDDESSDTADRVSHTHSSSSARSALRQAQADLKAALTSAANYRKLYYNANRTISRNGKRTLEAVSGVFTRSKKRKVCATPTIASTKPLDQPPKVSQQTPINAALDTPRSRSSIPPVSSSFRSSSPLTELPFPLQPSNSAPSPSPASSSSPSTTDEDYLALKRKFNAQRMQISRLHQSVSRRISRGIAKDRRLRPYKPRTFRFKTKGGIIDETVRVMVRELAALEIPHAKMQRASEIVLAAAGLGVEGSISTKSIERIVQEGYVAAAMQVMYEIQAAESWTGSGDGTGHRHIEHISHHIYLTSEFSDDPTQPVRRNLGVRAAPGKSAEVQVAAFQNVISEYQEIYEAAPMSKKFPIPLHVVLEKFKAWLSDHAKNEKKTFTGFDEWKQHIDRERRGAASLQTILSEQPAHLRAHVDRALEAMLKRIGGLVEWDSMHHDEQRKHLDDVMVDVHIALGQEVFDKLSEEEKAAIDLFVWVGCGAHKIDNATQGGIEAVHAFWAALGVGPVPLMNRDNAAAVAADPTGAAAERAAAVSQGGAVKVTTLGGMILNHHNDKMGQKDSFRAFILAALGHLVAFPQTSNNRFNSHGEAACELLVHLALYLEFFALVRDHKDKMNFNHVEHNVYTGLQDPCTLTELAVLALWTQSVIHPLMRHVRGDGHSNALNLGPFWERAIAHCESIAANPDLLLGPSASYITGSFDGKAWERPDAVHCVQEMYAKDELPHVVGALVAMFRGGAETLRRFTAEFRSKRITSLTARERSLAAVPATNDHNESTLGRLRVRKRAAPSKTELTYNAETMYADNNTRDFYNALDIADKLFIRRRARDLNLAGLERKKLARVAAAEKQKAEDNRVHAAQLKAKRDAQNAVVDAFSPNLDLAFWLRVVDDPTLVTVDRHLDPELRWHRRHNASAATEKQKDGKPKPLVIGGTKSVKLATLVAAVTAWNTADPPHTLPAPTTTSHNDSPIDLDTSDLFGEDDDMLLHG